MPGQIKQMLDTIIRQRSRGDATLALTTKTKILLKGMNPDKFTAASPDDPKLIERARAIGAELGVRV